MTNNVEIIESNEAGHLILDVSGEIDLATAPQLQRRLEAADDGASIIVDLSKVTFIDSTGLRVLITSHDSASESGGRLAIVAVDGPVTKLFSITGVDEWLNVHESRASAAADG